LTRSISTGSLTPSTQRSRVEQAWGCRSAALSSTFMAASYGRRRTNRAAPCSYSTCRERNASSRPLLKRARRSESRANTSYEIVLIHRFRQVTQDPIVQGASPVSIIGKGRDEDCRYRAARVDKAPVEFEARHSRHMDV